MGTETKPTGQSSLGHVPAARWEFDETVTSVFTDMLRRSIPQHDLMRRSVFDVGRRFVQPGTHVVDLGCSVGDALAPFVAEFRDHNKFIGVEVSRPMLETARERFREEIGAGIVEIADLDLRNAYPAAAASTTLCILTLHFTPIEHRQRILREIFTHSVPGGALILVEKILGASPALDALMIDLYHAGKIEHGYSTEEVERKRLALVGVLVPMTASWNEDLLRGVGFTQVDCFWRWMNFAGWVAIK